MFFKSELLKNVLLHALILSVPIVPFFMWLWFPNLSGYNSDHAIHALMAEDFQWPIDFYYWGQNRLGSALPLFASVLCLIGFSGFYSIAIAQLALVVCTYFLFQSHFNNWPAKAAVAIFSLLPVYPFLVQVQPGHPVLAQLFFIGVFLAVFYGQISPAKKAFWLPIISFLAIVPLAVFAVLYVKELFQLCRENVRFVIFGFLLGFGWLILAKTSAHSDENYAALFTSWHSFIAVLVQHSTDLLQLLFFQTNKPGNSWLVIAHIFSAVLLIFLSRKKLLADRLFLLFLFSAIATYLLVCASNWNAIMERPLHHFTPAYFFFAVAVLRAWQNAKVDWLKLGMPLFLGLVHGFAAVWFLSSFALNVPNRISKQQSLRLLSAIEISAPNQTVGLIGTYWNTYNSDALSEKVISIPCEGELVRTWRYKEQVFAQSKIVLIKTGWRDDLPTQIMQHGYLLEKTSGNFKLDDFEYAFYRTVNQPLTQ